ncbi:MAG: AMP-binding protein [Alphaproteobacteria bacterium]|nr:AMP-binding protein [Alphaproteobacteria bacterium]
MHPSVIAKDHPERPAIIMASTGQTLTFGELDRRSNQIAQLFRSLGLNAGDGVALFLENHPRYLEITWGAQRAGLYYTCISSKLTAEEVRYIVKDCGAKVLITSPALAEAADGLAKMLGGEVGLYMIDAARAPFVSFDAACAAMPDTPIADQTAGTDMLYSSGTTGKPKGVRPALTGLPIDAPNPLVELMVHIFQVPRGGIYLCPAPLYHSAPLRFSMNMHRIGGTVVVMEKFDPEHALALIQRHKVSCAQFVPTHFVRMLKLPEETRKQYDVSSLQSVIHAAAPCPVPVKEQMIAWWGPVIHEYYAGTEGNGMCYIGSQDWLAHKGSVGRAVMGELHICDEDGNELPPRSEGLVFFGNGPPINYHNDPAKTKESYNKHGWSTLGDVGWVDEEGFLYLTDRKSFMIISGGVNIYPQEIENLLITHPKVTDAAVVGAPHEEMGEQVVAVIQAAPGVAADDALAAELMAFARDNLSHVKTPRRIDFMEELPRHATGKLYKRLIRDAYWGNTASRIVQ